jgi:hypothetical protein
MDGRRYNGKRTFCDGHTVYLFNNAIARRDSAGVVWLTLAGWATKTTKDRLNCILRAAGRHQRLWTSKGSHYYGTPCGDDAVEVGSDARIPLTGPLGALACAVTHIPIPAVAEAQAPATRGHT